MFFHPQHLTAQAGHLILSGDVHAKAPSCLHKDIFREFWHNFTFQASTLHLSECPDCTFVIGSAQPLPLNDADFSICIEPGGLCIHAETEQNLLYGFLTLIDRFQAIDQDGGSAVQLDCCQIWDKAVIRNRMVHFCIFPETELWELQKFLRFCAALRYTHVVLEFWGMVQLDCMRELAWPHAFTRQQLRPILQEASDSGLEIIPMWNHWGHASSGRVMHGKHVVLDQNPALQTYFSDDGWCWDIRKPKVRQLLRRIRSELIELCGSGHYFHIGCDEAYNFEFTPENMELICDFINEISADLSAQNRRALVWGDMFLYRHAHYNAKNWYTCNAPSPEAEQLMLARLSRDVILADWQYDAAHAPVETAAVFQQAGFDCLLCPWDRGVGQMNAVRATVAEQSLMGILHTTWHTLSSGMPYVAAAAVAGFEAREIHDMLPLLTQSAALLRKVMPVHGDYTKAGWSKVQVDTLW